MGLIDFRLFALLGGNTIGVALVLLIALNAVFLDGFLEGVSSYRPPLASWLRILKLLAAGVPLIGLYVMPTWMWLLERQPRWARANSRHRLSLRSPWAFGLGTITKRIYSYLMAVVAVNVAILSTGLAWATSHRELLDPSIAQITVRVAGLTSTVLLLLAAYRSGEMATPRFTQLLVLSSSWLLPWPFFAISFFSTVFLQRSKSASLLVDSVFTTSRPLTERSGEMSSTDWWRASLWHRLRIPAWLHDQTRVAQGGKDPLTLYRWKTFLLLADASGFAWLLATVQRSAGLGRLLSLAASLIIGFCLLLALVSCALVILLLVRRLPPPMVRRSSEPRYLHFGLLSLAAFLAGAFSGLLIADGKTIALACLLVGIGWLGGIGTWLVALLPSTNETWNHRLARRPWLVLLNSLALLGSLMLNNDRMEVGILRAIQIGVILSPLWAMVVGLSLCGRFLHPFRFHDLISARLPLSFRIGVALSILCVCMPLGGLAIPFWILMRHRLWPRLTPLLLGAVPSGAKPSGQNEPDIQAPRVRRSAAEGDRSRMKRDYAFAELVAHLSASGKSKALFQLVEETPFLVDQANEYGGFMQSLEDLENRVLPTAIALRDWNRFLHFAALALNLRGMAEELANGSVLQALVRHDQLELAMDTVGRLADGHSRVFAVAVLAGSLGPQHGIYLHLLEDLRKLLRELPLPADPDEAERQFWVLLNVAQDVGPDVQHELRGLLSRREEWGAWGDFLWAGVAGCAAERDGFLAPRFWECMDEIQNVEVLRAFLPEALSQMPGADEPSILLASVEKLSRMDSALYWLCYVAILGGLVESAQDQALADWLLATAERPVVWSLDLVEQGANLFRRLDTEQIEFLCRHIADAEIRVALRIVSLREHDSQSAAETAVQSIQGLSSSQRELHWKLRYLAAPHGETLATRRVRLEEISLTLAGIFYEAPTADLCLYLDLMARFNEAELSRELEAVFWAPTVGVELLFTLAEQGTSEALLADLFIHAESYILAFQPSEAEGFQAWKELLKRLAGRLCAQRGDLLYLDRGLAEGVDEDELRVAVARAVASSSHCDLTPEICAGIQASRLNFATRLQLLPDEPATRGLIEPGPLYRALATIDSLAEEILGLASLRSPAATLEAVIQRYLSPIQNSQSRILSLFRLVRFRHDHLASCSEMDEQQISLSLLSQAMEGMDSHELPAALIPELTEVAFRVKPSLGLEELSTGTLRTLTLSSISWSLQREALEGLLALLNVRSSGLSQKERQYAKELLARILADLSSEVESEDSRQRREDLEPIVRAVEARLGFGAAGPTQELNLQEEVFAQLPPIAGSLRAAVYLLAACKPEQVPALVHSISPGEERDELCLRLIRHSWVPPAIGEELLDAIEGSNCEAKAWLGTQDWVEAMAVLIAIDNLNPFTGSHEAWIRRLWTVNLEQSQPILARAFIDALKDGGRRQGEVALRLWLHAHLSPEQPVGRCAEAEGALRRSLSLPGVDDPARLRVPAASKGGSSRPS